MKQKLTTLLFGLLLAVGWTSSAFAQSATYKGADMKNWTYTWYDANKVAHTANYVDANGNAIAIKSENGGAYQIYGFLKAVYMDKRLPGPFKTAYMKDGVTRENEVYYGGITGGWNIPGGTTTTTTTVTLNPTSVFGTDYANTVNGVCIDTDGDLSNSDYMNLNGTTIISTTTGTITKIVFNGRYTYYPVSRLSLVTGNYATGGSYTTSGNVGTWTGEASSVRFTSSSEADCSSIVVTVTRTNNDEDFYKPVNNEGYTAVMVALVNDTTKIYQERDAYWGSFEIGDSTALINYIANNFDFVKLLTDGLRINEGTQKAGTVFNCDGRYNRFFILSKGQSRKKSTYIEDRIAGGYWPTFCGEEGPFKEMFEEFSPTTGATYSDVTDFYKKMMEGETYNVIHDCASVIQNKHQFSMSGKKGNDYQTLDGLNFYIPDYRLLWWDGVGTLTGFPNQHFDGRDMNGYLEVNEDGTHSTSTFDTPGNSNKFYFGAFYAQYNQEHAPKMGIYKITLDAEAELRTDIDTTHTANNKNYKVTLTWKSSLNEMSGDIVPQTYTVYYYDENGNREALVVTGYTNNNGETGETTLVYYVEQKPHSYTIDYIVKGTPNTNTHPSFVAWSNIDGVTIPGWDDFLILELDHHESDFVVKNNGTDKANWYRNFLMVENDINPANGLSVTKVSEGMNSFDLKRYDSKDKSEKTVAVLKFDNPTTEKVHYTVSYSDNSQISDLTTQNILAGPTDNPNKYQRATMQIPDEGYVRVRGNGDIIIQPNGYAVNFKSITVKNNGTAITGNSWTSASTSLPSSWILSPGAMWVKHNTGHYYLEGGGYICIPGILNNSSYTNVTLEINAYGDGSAIARIDVNDNRQDIDNTEDDTAQYTWTDAQLRTNVATRGNRAETDVTFTGEYNSSYYVREKTIDNVTINTTEGDFGASNYYLTLNGTTTISTTVGTITKIVFNGYYSSGYYPVSYLSTSTGNYTTSSDNVGTWTGNAQSIVFNSSSTSYISSIVVTVTTEGGDNPPTPVEGGLLRLGNLPIVDQLKEPVLDDNSHPDTYYYVLRYTPTEGTAKQSGVVPVDIQKTEVEVHGNYTKNEIDNDTTAALTMNIISADVTMDLTESDPYILHYEMQGRANNHPRENGDWLTKLQHLTTGKYAEDLEFLPDEQNAGLATGAPNPRFEEKYEETIHHYYDMDSVYTGTYTGDSYFCYAPSVSTWGLDRRYYETDGLDNTYGGPLWKTGVGDVEFKNAIEQIQMKQVTVNGQPQWVPNPSVTWTEGDVEGAESYTLYFLSTQAQGKLPKKTVSNIAYEPYMFRVFVESASGKLRKYEPVIDEASGVQIGLKDGGPITGKYCVGSFYSNSNTWTWDSVAEAIDFYKGISNDAPTDNNPGWNGNMKFGAATSSHDSGDLKVYVRFYYMTPGWNTRAGDGPDRPGNGAERGGNSTPSTGIIEIFGIGNGEVVSQTYFNAQGIQSDTPFDGLNIVVTRYSNGTTSTTKVIR